MNSNGTNTERDELVIKLQAQLAIARSEIKNLRQQIISLKHTHQKDVEEIQSVLKGVKCESCVNKERDKCNCEFPNFQSIGVIESWFSEKRGIPRQGILCKETEGVLTLHSSVLNNPSYALSGLEEFSHLWIIYVFHKTDSNHVRTKVAPPKLNGTRVGVFSTRSPHRPCPIGLSVVKVEKISENKIHFTGVDMLNGTPVLDIKPYIPHYDNPTLKTELTEREVEGGLSDDKSCQVVGGAEEQSEGRSVPDGEEDAIRIPSWIVKSASAKLKVVLSRKSLSQLNELSQSDQLKSAIINILEEDPRSVYLKQKLGSDSEFYTFLIKDAHVICQFYDSRGIVVVHGVHKAYECCECGIPKWQCSRHGE